MSYFLTGYAVRDQGPSKQLSLILLAPDVLHVGEGTRDTDSLALRTGKVIRDCGNNEFEMLLSPHHGIGYVIPITAKNSEALECVIESFRTMDAAVTISLEAR
jgi:hypothetical protein